MYSVSTNEIKVTATPSYQGKGVTADDVFSVWSYNIVIENNGSSTIQVLRRLWQIIDDSGLVKEITGDGVVGKTPVLNPGESFEYTSFTNLKAPSGVMIGKYYVLELDTGKELEIDIPAFSLDSPEEKITAN